MTQKPVSSPPATTHHRIVLGDARSMGLVEDKSVHLVVTSPPYWQLKDYGHKDQIGFDDTYEDYINSLNLVWSECGRVLHDGCRLCVNIGDQFARAAYYGRYKVIPIRTEIIRFCETIGFDYMGAVIWQKATTCNTTGGAVVMGSYPYPRNGIIKIDYEFILIFKKPGTAPPPSAAAKKASELTNKEWNQYFFGHWNFVGSKQKKHIAAFPEELPKRLIKMFSFVGETVLDPFAGSGTTSLVASRLGRSSVAYEMNPDCQELIEERIGPETSDGLNPARVEFARAPDLTRGEIEASLSRLPYRFEDSIALRAEGTSMQEGYGSVIRKGDPKRKRPKDTSKARRSPRKNKAAPKE